MIGKIRRHIEGLRWQRANHHLSATAQRIECIPRVNPNRRINGARGLSHQGWLDAGGVTYQIHFYDQSAFESAYDTSGMFIAPEQYTGSLANDRARIRLQDAIGQKIMDLEYKDGWRPITDGDGYSLTIIDETKGDVNSWKQKDSVGKQTNYNTLAAMVCVLQLLRFFVRFCPI